MQKVVPTTITTVDLLAKRKEIEEVIVRLKQQKNDLLLKTNEDIKFADELEKRKQQLVSITFQLLNDSSNAQELTKSIILNISDFCEQVFKLADEYTSLLKQLVEKTEEETKKIEKLKDYQGQIIQRVNDEHKRLRVRQKDLDIYKSRLETYFKEYLPDKKIIL